MRNPEMGGMTPSEEKPRSVAGVERKPDGSLDYSRAAVMEQPVRTFFGSEKGAQVKAMAEQLSHEENPLPGHMLDEMISFALFNPEADRNETSTHLMSKFNFDGISGEELPRETKQEALRTVMGYFDELQEIRDAVITQKSSEK